MLHSFKIPLNLLYSLKLTQEYKTLNPMQQVPAVEIDGITLSQSVSPQILHLCKFLLKH